MIHRASSAGPFGGGGVTTSVFGIDDLVFGANADGSIISLQGVVRSSLADEPTIVCQFPPTTSYLMVASNLIKLMTPLESATIQKLEEDALGAIFNPDGRSESETPETPRAMTPTGQYL